MKEFRCLATSMLGYGIPKASFVKGLTTKPHMIGSDMGSIDSGPYHLGSGKVQCGIANIKRDFEMIVGAALELGVTAVIGSAGTAGGDPHLAICLDAMLDVARSRNYHFKLATIHSEIPKAVVKKALADGKITPMQWAPPLTENEIDASTRIVAQMGTEPIAKALDAGADVVLAGRACDTAIFAALPESLGYDIALTIHMAKIIECSSLCAVPGGRDAIVGCLREDHFLLESQNPVRRCTPSSVAAHSLYEQSNPYYICEPNGICDTTNATYSAETDRIVRVSGSRWMPSDKYTIKLEGAKSVGYRMITLAGVRDPAFIFKVDEIIKGVTTEVISILEDSYSPGDYRLNYRVYGRNGVMGILEPITSTGSHELLIVIDVLGRTEDIAKSVNATAKQYLAHHGFEGRMATAGNLAFPISPSGISVGQSYELCIYHLMEIENAVELFPIEIIDV